MELIIDGRGTGKTTDLVCFSSILEIPIVTSTQAQVNYIIGLAKRHNLKIPEPITAEQVRNGYCKGRREYENVFVDDAYTSGILEKALNQYLHANVKICVIDKPGS